MKKTMMMTVGLFGLVLANASAAQVDVHAYRLPRVANTVEQCQQVESWVVERFARLADAKVINHGCERNSYRTFDLVIEYSKSVQANLVTTFDEHSYVNALYETADQCVAQRDAEMATFQAATGLEPLLAYCLYDRRDPEVDNGWTMRIDGFGKPKLSPQHMARDFYNGINGNVEALEATLKSTLEAYGAQNVKTRVRATTNRSIVHAMYYSAKRLPIIQYSEAQFKTLQSCESYRNEMRDVFAAASGQSAIFFCGGSSYTTTVYMYTAGIVMEPLATDLTSVKYNSFEECEAKRAETEASWRDGLEKNIVGSVCSAEEVVTYDYVRMRMFWLD
jgi:hypothetical protein